ncbi:EamA family transporter [Mucilaginibacter aquariorum]|uniref:DMT family transporter n=1 Tax=Mucilaginibacter aquariorum TaxID=2967225 RepID=A0ABT1SYV2_9SPHI|nr:EamA family transporter [Mucilaginibacter aquariorum]MCQ6957536.1 DMT family transporter [Mucilaginibacter aquariorum]
MHWGFLLSLFGTIVRSLRFTRGMPLIGMGLGAIIASIEIPVSVLMAHLLLKEPVSFLQWIGVILIPFTVVLMNTKQRRLLIKRIEACNSLSQQQETTLPEPVPLKPCCIRPGFL